MDSAVEFKLKDDLSLTDRVYLAIENAILSGQIALGERLLENDLSEKLSVSRAPLREALRRLHFEGLAETLPRRGTYVIKPSRKDVVDLLQIREQLECLATRLAAKNMKPSELEHLSTGVTRIGNIIAKNPKAGYPAHDIDFHQLMVQASGNAKLVQIMSSVHRSLRIVRLISGVGKASQTHSEHEAIIAALKRRNLDAAEKAMRLHLRAIAKNILVRLKD